MTKTNEQEGEIVIKIRLNYFTRTDYPIYWDIDGHVSSIEMYG